MPFRYRVSGLAFAIVCAASSFASLTYYSSRTGFNAAVSGQTMEDFEAGLVPIGGFASTPSPLDKNTNTSVFSTGSIKNGVRFVGLNDPGFTDFFLGNQVGSYTTIGLSTSFTGTGISVEFTQEVHSVGLDVLQVFGNGLTNINVYSASGLLQSINFSVTDTNGTFFGVSSTDALSKVVIYDGELFQGYDGVDNVAFSKAVPEPATFAAFGIGLLALRRRRR